MPTISQLQLQYPLSPRKFWKKMIEKSFFVFLLALLFGLVSSVIPSALDESTVPSIASMVTFFVLGFLVFFIVVMLFYAWYVKIYIRRYYYDANESFVTIKKGVFAPTEIHIQYAKIQDVYVDQDIIDRIMGLYDVHIASATVSSGIEAHIDGVEQAAAEGLKNLLLQKLRRGGITAPLSPSQTTKDINVMNEPVTFASEISSNTYPIVGTWFAQQMITWLLTSVLYSGLISFYFFYGTNALLGSDMFLPVFLGLFVVIYVFHLIYMVLWRTAYSFSFLPDYIVTKQGIIAKRENHLPYRSVQDVWVSQGIMERVLGIATVRIENAAAGQVVGRNTISSAVIIPGQPLVRANELSDTIKHVTLTKSSAQTGL